MDILNSSWLVKMLEKSSTTPHGRMLCLFDILDDWLEAPSIEEKIRENLAKPDTHVLQKYLSLEAAKAGAAMPEMLASQLYFMALAAMQEKFKNNNRSSLGHAKSAARALIDSQTKPEFRISKSSAYAIAASFVGALVVAGSVFMFNNTASFDTNYKQITKQIVVNDAIPISVSAIKTAVNNAPTVDAQYASPEQTAALFAQIDQMRKGNCQLIEALQLPDSYKKVYFENIVMGQISTNPADQKLVNELLQKVRCNYTPMLMANSK